MVSKDTHLTKDYELSFEEIDIGNQIIADFIGLKKKGNIYKFPRGSEGYTHLYFHSSFEWILQALDHIERLGYDTVIVRLNTVNNVQYSCKIREELLPSDNVLAHVISDHKVTAIWRAVITFCEQNQKLKVKSNLKTK